MILIDCEKVIKFLTCDFAQREKEDGFFSKAILESKFWRQLRPEWNGRDNNSKAEKSKRCHFNAQQVQPWLPFPVVVRQEPHPDSEVWSRHILRKTLTINIESS